MHLTASAPKLLGHLVRVAHVTQETADAVSIAFDVPAELTERFHFKSGQFLTIAVPSEETTRVARCYSISSAPGGDDLIQVTVKRTVDGYGSNWLCDNAEPGLELRVLPPSGTFTPPDLTADLTLVAAGSGVTPVFSILISALKNDGGKILFVYANRDAESVIFSERLAQLAVEHPDRLRVVHLLESEAGLPTPESLAEILEPVRDRSLYVCGPTPFMGALLAAADKAGLDRRHVHHEDYKSLDGDPFELASADEDDDTTPAEAQVDLDGRTHQITWPRSRTLVDVLLDAGIDAPYSCREGTCGSCMCLLLEGEVEQGSTEALDEEDIEDGYVLGCQSKPVSDRIHVEFP